MAPRIYIAVAKDEFTRLYDVATQQRLARLGEIVHGAEDRDGKVVVPDDIGHSADVLITSWSTSHFDPTILHGDRLRLAVHSAGSVRNLFPVSALGKALRLTQGGADAMALAVAEMALTLTLAQLRNLIWHDRHFQHTRDWIAGGSGMLGQSIAAQRVGVVSLSRVGRHYVRMLQGLGVTDISVHDPYTTVDDAYVLGVRLCDLNELCARSDVLSIHTPATPETEGLIGAAQLALLPDNAVVINTARAEVTDEQALREEVRSGRLRVGLDVYSIEPLPADSDLFENDNAILLPHVAGGTVQARFAQGAHVVAEIEGLLRDGTLRSEVTPENYHRLG